MRKPTILGTLALLLLLSSCSNDAATVKSQPQEPDMAQVRTEIQNVENQWSDALNKKDLDALMALYADDAISMQDGAPTLKGKAAIQEQMAKDFAAPPKYASISFQTQTVYGTPDEVTEVGTSLMKDAAGKEIGTGKYMAVYHKKDGKYKCISEIYNRDSK